MDACTGTRVAGGAPAQYYRTLLPWLDDALADRGDLGWWRGRLEALGPARVLELGCGTGRVTEVLAGEDRMVVGLDRLPSMLGRARERLAAATMDGSGPGTALRPGIHLVRGDLRAPPLRSGWDLIVAPADPLIHVRRPEDRQRALDAAERLLAPGGRLILELMWWTPEEVERARSPDGLRRVRRAETPDGSLGIEERWTLDGDGRGVTAVYRYEPPSAPDVTASFQGVRWTPPEIGRRFERAGLEIVRLRGGYDDRPFRAEEASAFLLEARRRRRRDAGWTVRGGRVNEPSIAHDRGDDMSELADRSCIPCTGDTPAVEGEELEALHADLHDRWEVVDGHHLRGTMSFDDFQGALDFTNRVGELAEAEGHHPEICVTWGEARVKIWTHAIDALSENDFVLAAKIDRILA